MRGLAACVHTARGKSSLAKSLYTHMNVPAPLVECDGRLGGGGKVFFKHGNFKRGKSSEGNHFVKSSFIV